MQEEPRITFLQAIAMVIATLFALWPEDMADLVFRALGIE
jgi:hypothetical protein